MKIKNKHLVSCLTEYGSIVYDCKLYYINPELVVRLIFILK